MKCIVFLVVFHFFSTIVISLKTLSFLTYQLRELEEEGFISREVFPVVPPKVEYSITKRGQKAIVIVDTIRNYGLDLMKEFGVDHSKVIKHKKEK